AFGKSLVVGKVRVVNCLIRLCSTLSGQGAGRAGCMEVAEGVANASGVTPEPIDPVSVNRSENAVLTGHARVEQGFRHRSREAEQYGVAVNASARKAIETLGEIDSAD